MKNPISFRVESSLGAIFISLLSLFFVGILFTAIKNFNTDIDVLNSTYNNLEINRLSPSESYLIQQWVISNGIEIPEGRGYKYLTRKYPDKPWLDL